MTITNKFVIPFLLIFVNSLILHSVRELTQKPVLAAETTPSAEVSNLPAVHILPDNPLYFLKTIKEKLQLLVARNASSQANLLLDFSQKRLAEAVRVAEKGKIHISEKLLEAFGKDIETAQEKINQAKTRGEQTRDLLIKLQKLEGQAEQLNSFLSNAPCGKIQQGLGIFDWLRGLFGKKEILSPLVD